MIPITTFKETGSQVRRAFTLVELLVSVGIIVVLAILLFSGSKATMERSKQGTCIGNLRAIGGAMNLYVAEYGMFPAHYDKLDPVQRNSIWYHKLLNNGFLDSESVLFCPSSVNRPKDKAMAVQWGGVGYGMNLALSTDFDAPVQDFTSPARVGEVSAPSRTIMAVDSGFKEGTSYQTYYAYPNKPPGATDSAAWPRHGNQCNVLFVDGHVSQVKTPNMNDFGSVYRPEALGSLGIEPNLWKRRQ